MINPNKNCDCGHIGSDPDEVHALQRLAMSAYWEHSDEFCKSLTEHHVEVDGVMDGDPLALFVWREVGEASNKDEAATMIRRAITELSRVADKLDGGIKLCLTCEHPLESHDCETGHCYHGEHNGNRCSCREWDGGERRDWDEEV